MNRPEELAHNYAKEQLRHKGGGTYEEYKGLFDACLAGLNYQKVSEQELLDEVSTAIWPFLTDDGCNRVVGAIKRVLSESGLKERLNLGN